MHRLRSFLLLGVLALAGRAAWAKPSCGTGGAAGEGTASVGAGTYRFNVPSSYGASKPIPLLVVLHGDEGTPDYIYSTFRELQDSTQGAFLLVAPKAPFASGSWYQAVSEHTDFVNQVIAKVRGDYNIDNDRIWISGWSGGATFLGYYAILRQDILAAVVYHMGGGGGGPYSPPPSSCKIPGRFLIGTADFLYDLAKSQRDTMQAQGHEVDWVELPGLGHDFDPSKLPETWAWLKERTLCRTTTPGSCTGGVDSGTSVDQGSSADQGTTHPADSGVMPSEGGGAIETDAGVLPLVIPRESDTLVGGCTMAGVEPPSTSPGPGCLLLFVLGGVVSVLGRRRWRRVTRDRSVLRTPAPSRSCRFRPPLAG